MGGGKIYFWHSDKKLIPMNEEPYDSEALLQNLLASHSDLLAGEQMNHDVPRRWLLVTREMSVPGEADGAGRWSLDHLFLDQDGVPTLVEVKRSSDTRIRREVVGQMLDYAANAVAYWPVEDIRNKFLDRCAREAVAPDKYLNDFLQSQTDEGTFWKLVSDNLRKGRIRMVFVADDIPNELQRIVEFLNKQFSEAEVYAVEVRQFKGEGLTTLVPRIVGQSLKIQPGTKAEKQWDKASFFAELTRRHGSDVASIALRLYEWGEARKLHIFWGRGDRTGSFNVSRFTPNGTQQFMFGVWTYGRFDLHFQWMNAAEPFSDMGRRRELAKKLESALNVVIPDEALTKRPPYDLATLTPEKLDAFLSVFQWVDEQAQTVSKH